MERVFIIHTLVFGFSDVCRRPMLCLYPIVRCLTDSAETAIIRLIEWWLWPAPISTGELLDSCLYYIVKCLRAMRCGSWAMLRYYGMYVPSLWYMNIFRRRSEIQKACVNLEIVLKQLGHERRGWPVKALLNLSMLWPQAADTKVSHHVFPSKEPRGSNATV